MLERPVFKELYRVAVVRGEGVLLFSDRGDHVLCGRVYEHLAPWLTGDYSSDEIVARLAARHGAAPLYYALAELEEQGYLGVPADGSGAAVESARSGLVVREAAGITVALTDDYLRPELEDLNRRALRTRRPWLLAKPWGSVTWVGPLFFPGTTCCWKCLEQRLRGNQPLRSYWWSTVRRGGAVRPGHAPTADCARWITGGSHAHLAGLLITREAGEARWHRHPVARRPQCPACGDARLYARQVVRPLRLAHSLKRFTSDGGHRCVLPRETMRTLAPLIDPLTGVVEEVRPLVDGAGGGAVPIHAFVADHAGAAQWHNLMHLRRTLPTRSGGKGRTAAQARTSAVAEAVIAELAPVQERYRSLVEDPAVVRPAGHAGDPSELLCAVQRDAVSPAQGTEPSQLATQPHPRALRSHAPHRLDTRLVAHRAPSQVSPLDAALLRLSPRSGPSLLLGRFQRLRGGKHP